MVNTKTKRNEVSAWVNSYGDNLYTHAYFKTSSKEIAEDLVQETFVAAFQSYDKFKRESNPKTWLFSILKNKIVEL